ncbi:hypothetical protein RAB80_003018 [Fusarium oxysporum f. sp. vasinfectum]|nr:hypothetical protein RAB80_003018 [Fusarium oxysporum f. sp. vasinfectum]KAK2695265.1 hypothetical protein QWA68_006686 [Fusarium oxysporum]KAK2934342.1 hypothetical protein FoTM2_005589 [Fusarium oxysporum f. sp. vasinfectum]
MKKYLCGISRSPNCAPNIANAGQGIAKVLTDAKVLPSQTFACELHAHNDLPALVFHFDRFECEQAVRHILYDSCKHGSWKVLVRDYSIKQGDVWLHPKDFWLTLKTIVTSL